MKTFLLAFVALAYTHHAQACVCIQGSGVNIRDAPCGSVIGSASTGACFSSQGGSVTCSLSGTTYTFVSFDYAGGSGWAADDFITSEDPSRCDSTADCSGVTIVSRAGWGARPPSSTTGLGQTDKYFIHHSVTAPCSTASSCEAAVRNIQDIHMDGNGWSDIGYNFVVGEDGRAYEGRGWDRMGAHASGWNDESHGICVVGTFTNSNPNSAALQAVQNLMQCGIDGGHVSASYSLHGHRDGVATECPGQTLYNTISGWPNFGGPLLQQNAPEELRDPAQ